LLLLLLAPPPPHPASIASKTSAPKNEVAHFITSLRFLEEVPSMKKAAGPLRTSGLRVLRSALFS
jgi:hypothetical protein